MESEPQIIEISSDEEGEEEIEAGLGKRDESLIDWLEEMFNNDGDDDPPILDDDFRYWKVEKDRKVVSDNSDNGDLTIFNEDFRYWKVEKERKVVSDDGSDDDCVVLEGDPDGPVKLDGDEESESDDLLIIAEKGQLACRDFPHSRHLCAKFPFSSTPHEKHCDLCHCYVCDSLAPCTNWGTGLSASDHCHSTDGDSKWKSLRSNLKQITKLALPPLQMPRASVSLNLDRVAVHPQLRPCSRSAYSPPSIISQRHDDIRPRIRPRFLDSSNASEAIKPALMFRRVNSPSKTVPSVPRLIGLVSSLTSNSSSYNREQQSARSPVSLPPQKRFRHNVSQNSYLSRSESTARYFHKDTFSSLSAEVQNQALPRMNASQNDASFSSSTNITATSAIGSKSSLFNSMDQRSTACENLILFD
ncbi:hypothetical protein QJS04_geneDACA002292 [Acorus gramineus]|uniref:Uncharacterized protein n=1 Tax=Acorus gramineus TaxID=55184 RepID=A0AAV9A9E4_ACOGR|nr:hypothetical protein QJS04_geneDACA002292 [Acorus gramineus]